LFPKGRYHKETSAGRSRERGRHPAYFVAEFSCGLGGELALLLPSLVRSPTPESP
jgi:hypothetical protein